MKKRRALALLMAAGMSLSTTSAIISPTAGAATTPTGPVVTYTMAEQYQPYIPDWTGKSDYSASSSPIIRSDKPLPLGTQFTLLDKRPGYDSRHDGDMWYAYNEFSVSAPYGRIFVYDKFSEDKKAETATSTARLLVQYPDASSEIITAKLTLIPTDNQAHLTSYEPAPFEFGVASEAQFAPQDFPDGTSFGIIEDDLYNRYTEEGWEFAIDRSTGMLTVAYPGVGTTAQIRVTVAYPDRTTRTVPVKFVAQFKPSDEPINPPVNEWDDFPADNAGGSSFGSS